MCFHYSVTKAVPIIEKRYNAQFLQLAEFSPKYFINGFNFPFMPVVTNEFPKVIQLYRWGVVPFWAKDQKFADSIKSATLNARSETLLEKPSFKAPFKYKRCLVITDGFFEWRSYNNKKYPYYIKMKNGELFSFAGLWDVWHDRTSGSEHYTFTIVTVPANALLSKIHNVKKRMPAILEKSSEHKWLSETEPDSLYKLLTPFSDDALEGYTISKAVSRPDFNVNSPDILEKIDYDELPD